MDIFKIIVTVVSLFTFTLSEEQVFSFELSLPDLVTGITTLEKTLNTIRTRSNNAEDVDAGKSFLGNLMSKIPWNNGLASIAKLLELQRRTAGQVMPNVVEGLGIPKSKKVHYPPNYYAKRLKILLKLQEKQREKNTPLNPPDDD